MYRRVPKLRGWPGKQCIWVADDPVALCMGAYVLAFIAQEFDDAMAFVDRGLAVNPNLAQAWNLGAWVRVWRGEPDLALEHAARAMRLSPLDPSMYTMKGAMAYAHFFASRYDMASSCAEKSLRDNPDFPAGNLHIRSQQCARRAA